MFFNKITKCKCQGICMTAVTFLTLSQTSLGFCHLCRTSLLKKKKKNENEQFLLFQCFLPVWRTFCHFHQILNGYQFWLISNCCLQTLSVWKSLKFVVWERVQSKKGQKSHKYFDGHLYLLHGFSFRWFRV